MSKSGAIALTPDNIKRKLYLAGVEQKDIANECQISYSLVNTIINNPGVVRSHKIERVITRITGMEFPPLKRGGWKQNLEEFDKKEA